jgi:hypothetical protein
MYRYRHEPFMNYAMRVLWNDLKSWLIVGAFSLFVAIITCVRM